MREEIEKDVVKGISERLGSRTTMTLEEVRRNIENATEGFRLEVVKAIRNKDLAAVKVYKAIIATLAGVEELLKRVE